MKVSARASCAFAMYAATAVLAGCGGGSGSPFGPAGRPAERANLPLGATVTVTYKAVHAGKPFQGADVWLRKCDPTGAYIRFGKTDAKGKVEWSGFKLDQSIELGRKAKIETKNGWQFRKWEACWQSGKLPLTDTFHV